MKKAGIPPAGEGKAGNGEVCKTDVVGKVHSELILAKPQTTGTKRSV